MAVIVDCSDFDHIDTVHEAEAFFVTPDGHLHLLVGPEKDSKLIAVYTPATWRAVSNEAVTLSRM